MSASPNLKEDYDTQLVHDEKVYPESKPNLNDKPITKFKFFQKRKRISTL